MIVTAIAECADSAGLTSAVQVLEPVRHDVDARRGTQPRLLVLGDLSSDEARTVPQDVEVAIERSRTHQTGRRKYHRWKDEPAVTVTTAIWRHEDLA